MELTMREITGDFTAPKGNIAIVASRFNDFLVDSLIKGAQDSFLRHGVKSSQIDIIRVPGAYEIPLACQQAAMTNRFAGILALGVLIRGSTGHYEYVASACANGLQNVMLKTNIPISYCVLTTDTIDQAVERAGTKAGNKGSEYAMSLLEMMDLLGKIHD